MFSGWVGGNYLSQQMKLIFLHHKHTDQKNFAGKKRSQLRKLGVVSENRGRMTAGRGKKKSTSTC